MAHKLRYGAFGAGEKEMAIRRAQVPSCLRARTAHGATTPVVLPTPIGTYGPLHAHDAAAGTAWIASSDDSASARASEVVTEAWEWLAPCTSDASDASEPRRCCCGMGAWNMPRASPMPRNRSSGISGVCGRSPNCGFGTTRTGWGGGSCGSHGARCACASPAHCTRTSRRSCASRRSCVRRASVRTVCSPVCTSRVTISSDAWVARMRTAAR